MPTATKRARRRRAQSRKRRDVDLLTRRELAVALAVHPITITKWQDQGLPIAQPGGKGRPTRYSRRAVEAWKAKLEAERAASGDVVSLASERAKQSRAQTRLTELQIRKREGELLEVAEVATAWAAIVAAVKAKVLAIPTAVAERIVVAVQTGGAAAAEALVRDLVHEALRELAAWAPPTSTEASA